MASQTIRYLFHHLICGRRPLCGFGSLSHSSMSTVCSSECFSFVPVLCLFFLTKGNKLFCSTRSVAEAAQQRFGVEAVMRRLESKEASGGVFTTPSCGRRPGAVWLPDWGGAAWLREIRRHFADLGERTGQRGGQRAGLRSAFTQSVRPSF